MINLYMKCTNGTNNLIKLFNYFYLGMEIITFQKINMIIFNGFFQQLNHHNFVVNLIFYQKMKYRNFARIVKYNKKLLINYDVLINKIQI